MLLRFRVAAFAAVVFVSAICCVPAVAAVNLSDLLVLNGAATNVLRFDGTTGGYEGIFAAAGNNLGAPRDMVVGPDGHLYVTSELNDLVNRYHGTTGAFIDAFVPAGSGGLDFPRGLAFAPNGKLYVSTFTGSGVRVFNGTTGAPEATISVPGHTQLMGIVADESGDLYVTSYGADAILKIDSATESVTTLVASGTAGLNGPMGMVIAPNGNLLVTSQLTNRVLEFDEDTGGLVRIAVSTALTAPADLLYAADGSLLVLNTGNNSIGRFDATTGASLGTFVANGSGGMSGVQAMVFNPPIPEPTASLSLIGLASLLLRRRRARSTRDRRPNPYRTQAT